MAKKKTKIQPETTETNELNPQSPAEPETPKVEDPIGDLTDGEAQAAVEAEPELGSESKSETEIEGEDSPEPESEDGAKYDSDEDDSEPESTPKPRPPAKLERLQKILAAAGIASRRSAESLIEQGRVQVNGKVVTVLGTKADLGRDHIRVDGKLLQGAERLRYFVLNKPRGFVTTVKDPEGRPTVMQFFEKMKERLYPVGRLDYLSEGLLVVTNDGELANRLTKAASGVEKTYLVKVAGQPTEAELDILRGGVAIDRGAPGSAKIRTSPARIRQVRQGDNPWYEVVLIEGRNRELRKMFEEIGHFVEKIRRTGYGPLFLDLEPGNFRELEPRELDLLRQAAEGKLRTPKSKEIRRRNAADAGLLPTVLPKPSGRPRQAAPPAATPENPASYRPKGFGSERPGRPERPSRIDRPYSKNATGKPFRSDRGGPDRTRPERGGESFRPSAGRTSAPNPVRSFSHSEDERPGQRGTGSQESFGSARPAGRSFDRPAYDRTNAGAPRPGSTGMGRTGTGRPFNAKPKFDKPAWKKPERPQQSDRPGRPDRPAFQRPAAPRRDAPKREARVFDEDLGPVRPPNLHIEEIPAERPSSTRPFQPRPVTPRSFEARPSTPRSSSPRPYTDRPRPGRPSGPGRPGSLGRPSFDRSASSGRPGSDRPGSAPFSPAKPFQGEGGLARPFTTSSGKPRAGGARPSSKPGKFTKPGFSKPGQFKSYGNKPEGRSSAGPAKRTFRRDEGAGSFTPRPSSDSGPRPSGSSRPYTPRPEGRTGTGWKPKPSFGGPAKPASGSRSGSKPGGFKSSGYKGKPGGPKRTGSRPTGKPGGKRRG